MIKQCKNNKHKWKIQDGKMICSCCNKVNDDKCYYCPNDGIYADFKDSQEISVCFKHLGDFST